MRLIEEIVFLNTAILALDHHVHREPIIGLQDSPCCERIGTLIFYEGIIPKRAKENEE